MEAASEWIVLAHILRPQGRKGEVLADLFTDFPDRFVSHPQVWLAPAGFAERPSANSAPTASATSGAEPSEVAAHWLPVGRNAGRIVLHFTGVDTIEQAERLAGKDVLVPIDQRLPLDPGAAYISDLIGSTVYDRGVALGVVADVEFATSPDGSRRLEEAAPLLSIASPEGDEILIPFANAFLLELDLPNKSIRMELPEGLPQINRPATKE
jgi:16S rRNA processing protein RimM